MAKAKKAASNTLHVGFVFDRSGSMGSCWIGAIAGLNEYVGDLKEDADAASILLTLGVFDTEFDLVLNDTPVPEAPVFTVHEFPPRGSTALNDAIAKMVAHLDARVGTDRAMVVVLTDGQENASIEYMGRKRGGDGEIRLAEMVRTYEARGNWTFVYLGANDADVGRTAAAYGVSPGNAAFYSSTDTGMHKVSSTLSSVTRARRAAATGQSVTAFADAGQTQDVRVEDDPAKLPDDPYATGTPGKISRGTLGDYLGGE